MTTGPRTLATADVAASLGRHLDLYRRRMPHYQTTMLNSLLSLWSGQHDSLVDIGGGTGVIGQCMAELFPVGSVTAVDVIDRFCPNLTIATRLYGGETLPFADGQFDAATLNNVVHHVPPETRIRLFREIRRAVAGPLYIKDHEARSWLDHRRLALLDFVGNVPFGGMVRADYLTMAQWRALAASSGFTIVATARTPYRSGLAAFLFPDRLEITMRWEQA